MIRKLIGRLLSRPRQQHLARLDLRQVGQDVRYALRGFRRTRAFTVTAVLTLGCGIGVTTAVFTVVNATLLRPLTYDRPEQLVELQHMIRVGTPGETGYAGVSWLELHYWREQRHLFAGVEAYDRLNAPPLVWRERSKSVQLGRFTTGLPALLGVAPIRGRVITAAEAESKAPVLLISEGLWSREFDRQPATIGATMTLGNTSFTIVGVMPAAFRYGPAGDGLQDVWSGLPERGESATPELDMTLAIYRLQEGLSLEQANAIAANLAEPIRSRLTSVPLLSTPWVPKLRTLDQWRSFAIRDSAVSPLLLLLGTGMLVLLVACANVANLFRARGLARREELLVRSALGASSARLARLLIVEGAVMTLMAAACAVLVAAVAVRASLLLMPPGMFMGLFSVGTPVLDWRVAGFAVSLSGIVAILSSVWPAIRLSQVHMPSAQNGRLTGDGRRRTAQALQALQVALALMIVIGAGLMTRSFSAAVNTDVGMDLGRVGVLNLVLPRDGNETPASQQAAADTLLAAVEHTPGVTSAAFGPGPVGTSVTSRSFEVEGHAALQRTGLATRRGVGPGYFATVGTRLLEGREFGPQDLPGSPPVALIDQATALRLFAGQSAVGRRFRLSESEPFVTVVGVVTDVVTSDFVSAGSSLGVYLPWSQRPGRSVSIVLQTDLDPATVMARVRRTAESIQPDAEITAAEPAASVLERAETYVRPRFVASLVSAFALLALLTAAVGLYGLLSYSVGRRQREIGVRVALGSTLRQIRLLIVADALRPLVFGIAGGSVAAWFQMRLVSSFVYGVDVHDWLTFTAASAVMLGTALLAILGPMRKATGVDPISALKSD